MISKTCDHRRYESERTTTGSRPIDVTRKIGIQVDPEQRGDVLTVAETADLLRVSVKSVYKAIKNGQLPVLRFGRIIRIPVRALERMLDESTPSGRENRS